MANDVAALPPNLLTTKQYEEQQAKLKELMAKRRGSGKGKKKPE